jgi:hypothetical protein
MAGTVTRGFHPRRVGGQTSVPLWNAPEGVTETFLKGSVVIFTSGYLVQAAASPVVKIAGISTTNAHNDSAAGTHDMEFVPALPGLRFEGTLCVDSTNTHILVQTNLGASYGILIDTTNKRWFIDPANTSDAVNIVKLVDALATVKPRVEFVFMALVTIFSGEAD